jgi:F0F1-type ATP synthase delta subunit
LNNLQALYQDNLQRQEVLNEEIAKAKAFREQEMVKVRQETEAILDAARKKAQGKEEEVIASAQSQAKDILERANLQMEKNYSQILEKMQAKAVEVGQQAVGYVLSDNSKHILHEALMKELIDELKGMKLPENIRLEKGALKVEVVAAYSLDETHKQRIIDTLQKRLGKSDLEINFKADANIVGGLILNFGGRVIDGSLSNRLRQALAIIQEKK